MAEPYPFLKGHGTENDFVLLPDHDGTVHGDLPLDRVRALCDRRAGLGADGVLRVIRSAALGVEGPEWFMDYRNADGSTAEMCGNGIRLFALHLVDEGLADPRAPIEIGTRDDVKTVTVHDAAGERITADLGTPRLLGDTEVGVVVDGTAHRWAARHVDLGNPHAVAFLDAGEDLDVVGPLLDPPDRDRERYPDGVNVEFVVRRGDRHVAMRVHERGSAETRSCGTGACAVMVAAAEADAAPRGTSYRVDVPGGSLEIEWSDDDRVLMTGPAVIVARGMTRL